jgi:protein TonB
LLPTLKSDNPAVSGVRNLLVPPDAVPVQAFRLPPAKPKKRTPWKPQPDGSGITERVGGRDWFGDQLFVEPQEGHPRSSFTTSVVVHVGFVAAFIAFVLSRPVVERLNVPATSAVVMLFAVVEPPPPVPQPVPPSLKREPTREMKPVGAPSPAPPAPPAGDPAAAAAPVEAPASVTPETGNEGRIAGVVGGAPTGGIEGGVVGGTGRTASAPGPPGPAVVRVGAGMKPPKKIKDVKPEYSTVASSARVHGSVVIELTISAEGKVQDAKVLVSVPLLDQAALEAVRQWEYEPSRLNGVAVAVVMTVVVNFSVQ